MFHSLDSSHTPQVPTLQRAPSIHFTPIAQRAYYARNVNYRRVEGDGYCVMLLEVLSLLANSLTRAPSNDDGELKWSALL